MIYENVNEHDFSAAFERMGHQADFSRDGLMVLYEYLYNLSEENGEPLELDVIAICSGYNEATPKELSEFYPDIADTYDLQDDDSEEEGPDPNDWAEALSDNTYVCGATATTVIFQEF